MRTPEGLLRSLWPLWLCTVTVWLIARNTVAKSPCKCGCVGGIYSGQETLWKRKISAIIGSEILTMEREADAYAHKLSAIMEHLKRA